MSPPSSKLWTWCFIKLSSCHLVSLAWLVPKSTWPLWPQITMSALTSRMPHFPDTEENEGENHHCHWEALTGFSVPQEQTHTPQPRDLILPNACFLWSEIGKEGTTGNWRIPRFIQYHRQSQVVTWLKSHSLPTLASFPKAPSTCSGVLGWPSSLVTSNEFRGYFCFCHKWCLYFFFFSAPQK